MAGKWTGRMVDASDDDSPTIEEWRSVSAIGPSPGFADDDDVAYRTTFADVRAGPDERAFLRLRGTYDRARVWIDGTARSDHAPGFVPTRYEVDPASVTELVVVPDDADCRAVEAGLDVRPRTHVASVDATPQLTDGGGVVDVDVTVDAGEAIDDAVTLSMRPEGFRGGASMDRVAVTAAAGECATVSKRLVVRDPSPWWPREYGPQHRYTIRVKLGDDSVERTVGFRTVERDDDGLLVNGRRVRVRGLARIADGDPRGDVRRAVDANATLLRVRDHVPSRELYAACDEAGVLVWQDIPDADGDVERRRDLVETIVDERGAHPSLAVIGVESDPVDPFAAPLGSGFRSRLTFRYRAWRAGNDRRDADAVAESVPDGIAAVPVSGPPGTDHDATHLAPGFRYLDAADVDWLLDRYPSLGAFVGAIETASLTDADADPAAVPDVDAAALDRRANDAAASRRHQAATLKTVVEALRRRESAAAIVASALRDRSPDGGPGVLTADGTEKPAFEAVASAFEPVQAVLDGPPSPGRAGITLVNDGTARVEPTVRWWAGGNEGETTVAVAAHGRADAGTAEIPAGAEWIELETSVGSRRVRNRYRL